MLKKYQDTIKAIHQRVKKLAEQMEESEKHKAKFIRRAQRDMKSKIKEVLQEKKSAILKNEQLVK